MYGATTIYLACKRCSVIRSLEEIIKATGITEQDRSSLKLGSEDDRLMVMEMGVFTEHPGSRNNITLFYDQDLVFL